jgi:molecular chaperone DnaJ
VSQQMQTPFGVMQSQVACRECDGVGKIFMKDGKVLPAWWLQSAKEILEAKIPAGIHEWAYIKYTGKWNDGISGKAGDLYIQITVTRSKLYERKWDNLYVTAPLTIYDLVLWAEVMIDHPEGKMKVRVPKWTQIGDMVKIANKWFGEWWVFNRKWDLFVIPKVDIPKKLSKEQEKLWSELRGKK